VLLCLGPAGLFAADASLGFSTALTAYEERRYAEAREQFRALARTAPDDVNLAFYLGRIALWFDEGAEALARLEAAVVRAPRDARIQNALGDAYGLAAQNANLLAKLGWAEKCRRAYERAVELEPDNPAFRWSLLGYHLVAPRIAGGKSSQACVQADEIKRLDPMSGRIAWATICLAEKRYAAAFAQFDDALRERPDDFLALYHVGRCAALSGEQLERGRGALRRCLELTPPPGDGQPTHASAHYRLANVLEKLGDASGAAAAHAAALQLSPDFRPAKIALRN
jgi:tetratricopeptide (TPR) repeat protein